MTAPFPGAPEDWYTRFVQLFGKFGVPAPDGVRRWFSDIEGGWDKATDAEKQLIYDKAQDYYAGRDPNKDHDVTSCWKCGSRGNQKNTRNGVEFFLCSNQDCGFNNADGDWKSTSWDRDSWREKRDKWREGGRKSSGSRGGRSYGGWR